MGNALVSFIVSPSVLWALYRDGSGIGIQHSHRLLHWQWKMPDWFLIFSICLTTKVNLGSKSPISSCKNVGIWYSHIAQTFQIFSWISNIQFSEN